MGRLPSFLWTAGQGWDSGEEETRAFTATEKKDGEGGMGGGGMGRRCVLEQGKENQTEIKLKNKARADTGNG